MPIHLPAEAVLRPACHRLPPGELRRPEAARPLPTPCRARGSPIGAPPPGDIAPQTDGRLPSAPSCETETSGSADPLEHCKTLLDISASTSDEWAFLAATLLDTLFERAGIHTDDFHVPPSSVLRLAPLLPAVTSHDLTPVSLHVGCTLDDIAAATRIGSWLLSPLPSLDEPAIDQWISTHSHGDVPVQPSECEHIDLYTDGSFNGSFSSWAFHAIGYVGTSAKLLGWAGGEYASTPLCLFTLVPPDTQP